MIVAYLDPATGAMVLQIVVAAVVGAGVFFRNIFLTPLAGLFHKKHAASESDLSTINESKS